MTIAFGADHAGFELKEKIREYLANKGLKTIDCGTYSTDSCDYPDFSYKAATLIANKSADFGVFVCGSGVGISIVANKVAGVRCALVFNEEMASLARKHNDANGIAFGARMIDEKTALACVDIFLATDFEGGRHADRVLKISELTGL